MFLLCLLVVTTLCIKKKLGDTVDLHPSFFIPLLAIVQIGLPMVVYMFVPNIRLYDWGVEVLCFFVLLYQLGAWIIIRKSPLSVSDSLMGDKPYPFPKKRLKQLLFLGYAGSVVSLALSAKSTFDYAGLTPSFENLIKLASINSVVRYEEEGRTTSLIVFITNTFYYFSAFFSGIFLSFQINKKEKWLVALSIFFGLAESILQGVKLVVLVVTTLVALGYWIMNIYSKNGRYLLLTTRRIKSLLMILAFLVSIFYMVHAFRYYQEEQGLSLEVGDKVGSAIFGHVAAFSIWYEQFDYDKFEMGFYNFGGIYNQLGLKERSQGIYSDSIFVSPEWDTNVYTIYRGILQDFNVFSYAIMILVGSLATWLYDRVRTKFDTISVVGLTTLYLYFIWAHATSLLNYNVIVLSIASIFAGLLYLKGYPLAFFNRNAPKSSTSKVERE